MGVGYSIFINSINTLLGHYLIAIHILTPRRGNRYANWIILSMLYNIWVIYIHYGTESSLVIYPFIGNCVVMWVLSSLLYRDSWKLRLEVVIFFLVMGIISDSISLLFMTRLIPEILELYISARIDNRVNMIHLIGNICCEICSMTVSCAWMCLVRRRQTKLFLSLMLIPLYQFILLTGFLVLCGDFTGGVAGIGIAIGTFSVALDIMILYFLDGILKKQDLEKQVEELSEKRRREYEYFETYSHRSGQLRMIRHDFSNHMQALHRMLEDSGSEDMVRSMLREMEKGIQDYENKENRERTSPGGRTDDIMRQTERTFRPDGKEAEDGGDSEFYKRQAGEQSGSGDSCRHGSDLGGSISPGQAYAQAGKNQ